MTSVTVWNEYRHEHECEDVSGVYPDGIHGALAEELTARGHHVRTAILDESDHGLTSSVLGETDVLLWWGHKAHHEVSDDIVERVKARVLDGMGLVVLHSGHYSKIFKSLMGTSCALKWREADETERLWVVDPSHPIAAGIDEYIELPEVETYGEHFDIPEPDSLVFTSWFEGGEVFRSGCCYHRGKGRIFYFRPGHETYPIYRNPEILTVLDNAIEWAEPNDSPDVTYGNVPAPESN